MFLAGETAAGFTVEILVLDVDAADAAVVGKWVLLAGADAVYRLDTTNLAADAPGTRYRGVTPRAMSPRWDIHDQVTHQHALVPA